jgi:chaperonin cofactor prefoldin
MEDAMPAAVNLLARKQKLIEQLKTDPAADERNDIERQLNQINTALDLLETLDPSHPRWG